ncbi:MAG: YqeG family HAD IIIA-type phosphatase [Oscillospiraceae bacterium]|nr:YqeG family HAD IIIA-type phosphatase [Oscillospiraceae bacterium]
MGFSLLPDRVIGSIFNLNVKALAEGGVRLLLADLDNTIVPYSVSEPTEQVFSWVNRLDQNGIRLFIISNNRSKTRIKQYCARLGVPYVDHAGKPGTRSFLRAMEQMHVSPRQTAVIGDQIFTDVLGAKRAGLFVILVRPIDLSHPLRALRYQMERPVIAAAKRKMNR